MRKLAPVAAISLGLRKRHAVRELCGPGHPAFGQVAASVSEALEERDLAGHRRRAPPIALAVRDEAPAYMTFVAMLACHYGRGVQVRVSDGR